MPWWGWLILAFYVVGVLFVSRKRATDCLPKSEYSEPDNEEYALAAFLGVINGLFWPLFLICVFLLFLLFPSKAIDFLHPFAITREKKEEDDRSDDEVRKEVERLRREYTMPKWKRFILRLIHV